MNTQTFYPPSLKPVPSGRTQFRSPGFPARLQLDRSDNEVTVRTQNFQDTLHIRGDANSVTVDRYGSFNDVQIRRQGKNIRVDRPGFDDLSVERDDNNLRIDRPGFDFDVSASFSDRAIQIRQPGTGQITTLERRGDDVVVKQNGFFADIFPEKLFPGGGWPEKPSVTAIAEFSGIEARNADTLDRWSEDGINFDDLVRVNRQGEFYTFDDEFR